MTTNSRQHAAGGLADVGGNDGAIEALNHMVRALELLDAHSVPADIGAHLDLAIHRLRQWACSTQIGTVSTVTDLK